jgi:hydrogenase expression/formation protein HypD
MGMLNKFRDKDLVQQSLAEIRKITTQPWAIMEICGGQTHAIMQYGLHDLLPEQIELIHGPGCPVCVTSLELVDKAITIASKENVIFTSYGDMLRVPGSGQDLFSVKASGGDVRVVYSSIEALRIAEENPDKEVVFFGIGFETTAPANAISVVKAKNQGIRNYSMLVSQVCVPPAMHAILGSPANRVQGFLAAGHVCAVMGYQEYEPIAQKYKVPMAVTGFEPLDLTLGILETVRMLEKGEVRIENAYSRVVTREGNLIAQKIIRDVFEPCDRQWRGIGLIPMSGWKLRPAYQAYDAEIKFEVQDIHTRESEICISGLILQGIKKPLECPAFGTLCTPQNPLGATMVSSEGACSAYYRYARD